MTPESLKGKKIGCLGCGAMGGAILGGLAGLEGLSLYGWNRTPERMKPLEEKGIQSIKSMQKLAECCDILLLGVKPYAIAPVIKEIEQTLSSSKVLVSVAAGISTRELCEMAGGRCPIVRVMPNTPALVREGIFALCLDDPMLGAVLKKQIIDLFAVLGSTVLLTDDKMGAFSALIGCGPAYVFHFIDALAEAGVTLGFPRQQAIDLVIRLVSGSAKLAEQSGQHPAVLREQVCSPAGTTIAAMNHLDRTAVRGHMIDAVLAAYAKDAQR